MEHVIPKGENFCPVYSIEFRPKTSYLPEGWPVPWAQHHRTTSKWGARLAQVESFLARPIRFEHRVRVL